MTLTREFKDLTLADIIDPEIRNQLSWNTSPSEVPLRLWIMGVLNMGMAIASVIQFHIKFDDVEPARREAFYAVLSNLAATCATAGAIVGSFQTAQHFSEIAIKFAEMSEAFHSKQHHDPTHH